MAEQLAAPRHQSTGFPILSLEDAALVLKSAGQVGRTHTQESLAGLMGHKTTNSGPFRRKLAALRDWGVIEGRANHFSLTPVGLAIGLPTDAEGEAAGLRAAFLNSSVFTRAYRNAVKNQVLDINSLANNAVRNLGVAPAARDDFARSLVSSAVVAGLAERSGDRGVRFFPEPAAGEPVSPVSTVAIDPQVPEEDAPLRTRQFDGDTQRPVLRQVWPTASGQVVLEIRSSRPLRAEEFTKLAGVVSEVQGLAELMAEPAGRLSGGEVRE